MVDERATTATVNFITECYDAIDTSPGRRRELVRSGNCARELYSTVLTRFARSAYV